MTALRPWPVTVNEIAYIQDSKTNVMSDTKWDHVTDIVVVGSRAARYCAAVTARSEGAEVLMIEKGTGERGASKCSGGEFWTPNNRFQKERGITDAKEDAVKYMARCSYPQLYDPSDRRLGLPKRETTSSWRSATMPPRCPSYSRRSGPSR